jgi:two-component system CheB/CheR fusion protein
MPKKGHVRIQAQRHTTLEVDTGEAQWILCAIGDSGVEMAAEDQSRASKGAHPTLPNEGGDAQNTALGLAIARGIIELHGGRMWMESKAGRGNMYFFTLPGA